MSFQGTVEVNCPSCTDGFDAPVWSFVHGGTDAAMRDSIKARECNLLLCPSCGAAFMPEVSWIYYEPDAELMAFVFPEKWKGEEATWREKMKADFAQMKTVIGDRLPSDMEPLVFFGQEELGELLDKEDWRIDERDVMLEYAKQLGLSVYRASPAWARANGAPAEFPYKGKGAPTRESLIAGMKDLIKANDALTGWSDFLGRFEKDKDAAIPPPAKAKKK
jgi:CpXC motif protein